MTNKYETEIMIIELDNILKYQQKKKNVKYKIYIFKQIIFQYIFIISF